MKTNGNNFTTKHLQKHKETKKQNVKKQSLSKPQTIKLLNKGVLGFGG